MTHKPFFPEQRAAPNPKPTTPTMSSPITARSYQPPAGPVFTNPEDAIQKKADQMVRSTQQWRR